MKVHSRPGDVLCDFFAGSGTLGESAMQLGRNALLVDSNLEAVRVMRRRFAGMDVEWRRGAARAADSLLTLKEASAEQRRALASEGGEAGPRAAKPVAERAGRGRARRDRTGMSTEGRDDQA